MDKAMKREVRSDRNQRRLYWVAVRCERLGLVRLGRAFDRKASQLVCEQYDRPSGQAFLRASGYYN